MVQQGTTGTLYAVQQKYIIDVLLTTHTHTYGTS